MQLIFLFQKVKRYDFRTERCLNYFGCVNKDNKYKKNKYVCVNLEDRM